MKYFALTLIADSPLTIRADHAPGGAASAPYIPGTTLAGSLAAAYRLYYPDDETGFRDLFLKEQVWFPNLYPASFKKSKDFQLATTDPICPLPKTAQSCKRFPGFQPTEYETDVEGPRHGVRDSLLDWAIFELGNRAGLNAEQLLQPLEQYKKCRVCEEMKLDRPMDHFPGYYRRLSSDSSMLTAKVKTRLQTRNGINRETGTVEERILYNRQVIEEDAHFWGLVKMPDGLASSFEKFVGEAGNTSAGWLRIGTGRTRGMGKVGLKLGTPAHLSNIDAFRARLEAFDAKLREKAKPFKLPLSPFYFALTLHSPAILSDGWQGYATSIHAKTLLHGNDTLASRVGLPAASLQRVYQFSSTRRVTGWNELWGTPRANEIAIDTGSVFLFACTESLTEDRRQALIQALAQLEEEGIGRRKAEGFGRICISDPFHREVTLQ